MRFKCHVCNQEFDDIQQLAAHKKRHQTEQSGPREGITCLGCAGTIPITPAQYNYSGPLTCPRCKATMKVTLRDGEVVVARFG
jgi:transposase-like protein